MIMIVQPIKKRIVVMFMIVLSIVLYITKLWASEIGYVHMY